MLQFRDVYIKKSAILLLLGNVSELLLYSSASYIYYIVLSNLAIVRIFLIRLY